ncbi:transcriptional regulator [Pasteurellaceae bacterium LFhippo2]|nr:transcriptional regulator [Pasteurellaceae bacterium LFhippo2]OOH91441.1 transcriptional regulator [Pasteurellaceae bacterium 15-036681]
MQLNKFTDYGFRILIYISRPREEVYTITELADKLQLSQNHLVKIVHFMAKQNWIVTSRGRGGGIKLAPLALTTPLGEMVRTLQGDEPLVNCAKPLCTISPKCGLKAVFDQAMIQFYQYLNQYTLAQCVYAEVSSLAEIIPTIQTE